jgi:hypothetical protein
VTILNRPIFGIEAVMNERPISFSRTRETDEAFRTRIRGALERAGKGTVGAIAKTLTAAVPEITAANLQVEEDPTQPGLVRVRVGLSDPTPALVARVEAALFEARPAGVRVIHNLAPAAASPAAGGPGPSVAVPAAEVATLEGDPGSPVVALRVDATLRFADPAGLAAAERERLMREARERLVAHVAAVPMGREVVLNRLIAAVLVEQSVLDVALGYGLKGGAVLSGNLATTNKKVELTPEDVILRLAGEAIWIDLVLTLEARPNATPGPIEAQRPALEAAATAAMVAAKGALTRADLASALSDALSGSPWMLASDAELGFVADYEETGQRVDGADEVTLDPHHAVALRWLDIRMEDALSD